MRSFLLSLAVLLTSVSLSVGQTIQGTIKKIDGFTVGVYLQPSGGSINGTLANFNITISIPNIGPAPVLTSVTSLPGASINPLAVETINGRHVYAFVITGNVTGGIAWVSGMEYLALTAVFPDNPETNNQIIQLNDFSASFGGSSGQALFDIGVNGIFYVDYANMFYGTGAVNVEFGDSYVQANAALPVTLIAFTAEKFQNRSSYLTWSTSSEINSSHFNIQRSFDNKSWSTIGKVSSTGNSQIIQNYEFMDQNVYNGVEPRLTAFYRLQAVDIDGQMKNSPIKSVVFTGVGQEGSRQVAVYPNPSSEGVYVEWELQGVDQPSTLEFFDINGKLVYTRKVAENSNQEYIDFSQTSIIPGLYIMRVLTATEAIDHKQIVVDKR